MVIFFSRIWFIGISRLQPSGRRNHNSLQILTKYQCLPSLGQRALSVQLAAAALKSVPLCYPPGMPLQTSSPEAILLHPSY